jgi:hypothetical protein
MRGQRGEGRSRPNDTWRRKAAEGLHRRLRVMWSRNVEDKPWFANGFLMQAPRSRLVGCLAHVVKMYHGCRRSTGGFETRAAAPTPSAVDHAQLRPRTACNNNNIKDLAVDGDIQRRRYWYEVNGKLDYAMDTFEYVRDLCDALHKQLRSLSTSAVLSTFSSAPHATMRSRWRRTVDAVRPSPPECRSRHTQRAPRYCA